MQSRSSQGYRSILVGTKGEVYIQSLFFDWGWLPRLLDQRLDQGLDLMVEVGKGGRGVGVHFAVQAKSTTKPVKISAAGVTVRLKKRNVEYIKAQRIPVLLMYVDIKRREIYWVDVRRVAKEGAFKKDGSLSIKIPTSNKLTMDCNESLLEKDRESLLKVVRPIGLYGEMPDLLPEQAIKAAETALSELDPNLEVRIAATSAGRTVTVFARKSGGEVKLRASMLPSSDIDMEKMRESIGFGVMNEIAVNSFTVSGSPLFDELSGGKREGKLIFKGHSDGLVSLKVGSYQAGRRSGALLFRGEITRGLRGSDAVLSHPAHPLAANIRFIAEGKLANFNLDLNPEAWKGKSLLSLDGLQEAADVLDEIVDSRHIKIGGLVGGIRLEMDGPVTDDEAYGMAIVADALRDLDDLKELALRYAPDLIVGSSAECVENEAFWWRAAYKLLDGEIVNAILNNLSFEIERNNGLGLAERGNLILKGMPLTIFAFGKQLCEMPVDVYLKGFQVNVDDFESERLSVRFNRIDGSVCRIRLSTAEPWVE